MEVQTEAVTIVDENMIREEIKAAVKAISLEGEDTEESDFDSEFEDEFEKCFSQEMV